MRYSCDGYATWDFGLGFFSGVRERPCVRPLAQPGKKFNSAEWNGNVLSES
jgi:hypothetical protein